MAEHVQLAGHAHPQHQLLAAIGDLVEGDLQPREALVDVVQRALVALVDEQPVDPDEEVIAGGAFDRPVRQLLVVREDLLDDQVEAARPGRDPARSARGPLPQPLQVVARIEQAVHMVDAHPVQAPAPDQIEREGVHELEHRRVLHADGRQLVDVEEAPVVDLFAGHAPVRQTVGLRAKQRVERVEAVRLAGDAVQTADGVGDVRADARRSDPSAPPAAA